MQRWQCRTAPSLGGGFAGRPNDVWETKVYDNDTDPTVFFGLYGLPDFYALWRHKGRKAILWAGSDITHFLNGYWLDDKGKCRLDPKPLAEWIAENCESYVENHTEFAALLTIGIVAEIVPSFLGDIEQYTPQRTTTNQYYTSVSGDDFKLYGWDEIDHYAKENPHLEFHLYGNEKPWTTGQKNVFVHGRISQEEMNKQIMGMTGALRLTRFDGASEILIKSLLWGQQPVSPYIPYPKIAQDFKTKHDARDYYLEHLNKYPWNAKVN